MTVLTLWFLDKSNASSFASAASRPQSEKSMSVCSGWRPQRVMIWGISETTDRMASTPLPSELLSRLRWGKTRCQGALTERRTLAGRHAHLSDVSAAAEGSSLLSTIAPGTPTPLLFRSSSVMVFSRKETSGIPQKSVILACSSTTVARFSAASPVMSLKPTLHHQGTQQCYEKLILEVLGRRHQRLGCHRVFAFLSAGADTKANTLGQGRT